jgi:YfiH family protein
MRWRDAEGVRWLEADLPGARAAFTTRIGGVSEPPFDTLNIGFLTDDDGERVRTNRGRMASAVGVDPLDVLIGRQVHGVEVELQDERQPAAPFARPGPRVSEVDGQATVSERLAPLVFVADCLPVALAGPGGVAMVHCGWRGLAGGIIANGVAAVEATAAAIGPGIGPCCYEVGPEVLEAFADLGEGIADGRMLDLVEVARRLLARSGVQEAETSGLCTSCERELFFSHRRDQGRTGRQAGIVCRWPS